MLLSLAHATSEAAAAAAADIGLKLVCAAQVALNARVLDLMALHKMRHRDSCGQTNMLMKRVCAVFSFNLICEYSHVNRKSCELV